MFAAACTSANAETTPDLAGGFPVVQQLPARAELPDIFQSGPAARRATTPEDMLTWRGDELRAQFVHYIYGAMPSAPGPITIERAAFSDDFLGGKAIYEELALRLAPGETPALHVALFTPKRSGRFPVIVGPNKCGNQSVIEDPRVRATTAFIVPACEATGASGRGGSATSWSVETIIDRGFALATYHDSDAAPDDGAHQTEGLRARLAPPADGPKPWGAIATWAFATHRVVDALALVPAIDPRRVVVFGHSRRGKAALWAGATDSRIALVIAHQSGTAGAALARSKVGESIGAITTLFPYWFDDVFPTFANEEDRLPIDQHQLLALLAPRPVLVTDGDADTWADPPGARAAVESADAAWKLFGAPGLLRDPNGATRDESTLVWRSRPGGHAVEPSDWTVFLDFASRHLPPP